uniref:Uncharacterized protein n=1 Tax=Salmonella sp. TaxID=599 RepID=A0A482EVK7_SALSP|nr:hypothetical protein NNIBIDOC_00133 [Salmonella sp.]
MHHLHRFGFSSYAWCLYCGLLISMGLILRS